MATTLFVACLLLGAYPYIFYPLLAWVIGRISDRKVRKGDAYRPPVTIVIAAYNEAKHIEATVRNKLELAYPRELLDVVVVSDGSSDGTDDIVQSLAAADDRVRFIRQEPRQGKTAALNLALARAKGDVVVFSDANSIYERSALKALVRNFADPDVGYVSGQMKYVNPDGSLVGDGCTAYMRYENRLREAETRLGSIVGVDGGIDAVRRDLFRPMRADQLPDFVLPLTVVEQGRRVVFERDAVLQEEALGDESSEFRMRVRVSLRALWALWDKSNLLNPFRYGRFAFQLWSHKVLRYLSFIPFGIASVLLVFLVARGRLHWGLLALVVVVLAAAHMDALGGRIAPLRYLRYFVLLNTASAAAFVRFVRREKQVIWKPREG